MTLSVLALYSEGMSQNILNQLTVQQLKRAVAIKEQIARLEKELTRLLGGPDTAPVGKTRRRRKLSAAGRARMAVAAKARWAKIKAAKK